MFYIFDKSGKYIASCDFAPNLDDLATRGEVAVESKIQYDGDLCYATGKIVQKPIATSGYHVWDGAKWTLDDKQKTALLADKKAEKLTEINDKAQAFVSNIAGLDIVPDYEVKTWQIQGEEAKAWHADKAAATPNLDAIAAARGIPADILKQKAYEKTVKFELLTAVVAGLRQGYEDANKAAKTLEDVAAINPIYTLLEIKDE